jgi:hypothetical protein
VLHDALVARVHLASIEEFHMAIRHQRSVWFGLSSAVCALVLSACAAPAEPVRPGVLELRIEPEASYTLVGRFHVNAVEPYSPSRDVDFDAATSRARIELPAGRFALLLGAGARLVCAGEETLAAPATIPRLVSASPQVISIAPGEVTTAHISFGAAPAGGAAVAVGANGLADPPDPCATPLAQTELAAWH